MLKIAKSLLTIVAVAAIATGATGAYFSSSISNNGNSFATGTLALNVNGTDQAGQTAVFGEANLAPGDVIPEHTFTVSNVGSLNANHLDLEVTLSGDVALAPYIVLNGSDGARFGGPTKAGTDTVRFDVAGWTAGDTEYGVSDGLTGLNITGPNAVLPLLPGPGNGMDRDLDGRVTLADFAAGKVRITPGTVNAGIASGTTATLWFNSKLDPATPDSMQGKTVTATFTWTLHQDASQF
ncbi:MAG: TasA family protein [Candidatus Berkelbacteria bacterium]|nr:TasA family protein [Candidatus Berkelbacteria bacterium]